MEKDDLYEAISLAAATAMVVIGSFCMLLVTMWQIWQAAGAIK